MAFTVPTLSTLIERITVDLETSASWTFPRIPGSPFWALVRVVAGVVFGINRFGQYIADQILPDTADDDYIVRHGSLYGLTRVAAVASTGNFTFTGTNSTVVPAGTLVVRNDGVEYQTTALGTIASGSATIAVEALVGGTDGDLAEGETLSLSDAISGVDGTVTVASGGLTGGADLEDLETFRLRILDRLAYPPQGGSESDYIAWAKAALSTVDNAYPVTGGSGPGTITVWFTVTGNSPIPSAGNVTTVQNYIDDRYPVTADPTAAAPTAQTVNVAATAKAKTGYATATIEAEMAANLRAAFREYITKDALANGGTLYLSQISGALSVSAGEDYHTLTTPASNVSVGAGTVPVLGTLTVTWI